MPERQQTAACNDRFGTGCSNAGGGDDERDRAPISQANEGRLQHLTKHRAEKELYDKWSRNPSKARAEASRTFSQYLRPPVEM